jgi:hypothetical protein
VPYSGFCLCYPATAILVVTFTPTLGPLIMHLEGSVWHGMYTIVLLQLYSATCEKQINRDLPQLGLLGFSRRFEVNGGSERENFLLERQARI